MRKWGIIRMSLHFFAFFLVNIPFFSLRLAVKYLFLANEGGSTDPGGSKLRVEPFDALLEQNDYEVSFRSQKHLPLQPNLPIDTLVPPRPNRTPPHVLPLRF